MISSPSELLRRSLRSVVPGRAYRKFADTLDAAYCVAKLGWRGWRRIQSLAPPRTIENGAVVELTVPSLQQGISIRAGTTDAQELVYVAIRETYGAVLPEGKVNEIVDAGASFGESSAWYLSRFRDARLIAIEPHPDSFRLLERNLRPYGSRAAAVRAALWHRPGALVVRPAASLDSTSVEEMSGIGDCEAMTVTQILERFGIDQIDIFKCDIEGAERELFEHECDLWLDRTRFIAIETHGPECLSTVVAATRRHGFRYRRHRNVHFFHR